MQMVIENKLLLKAHDEVAVATARAEAAEKASADKDARIAALETEKTELSAKVQALEAEKAEGAKTVAAKDAKIAELEKQNEETKADVDRQAGVKAAAQLAKAGFKAIAEATEEATAPASDLWAQYHAISDLAAKREFYLKHQARM